ncbi:MAG TPA: aldo/keto reductase [Steroidobacteraceae bacterium]|jgi:diketogulonate reductase-like aldo/keto reductase|nr:aldo/keto reductase [Steroidobacteraceae bacterium]
MAASASLAGARAAAAGPLLTRKIPSSGESIPALGLGTSGAFEVGDSPKEREPLKEVLRAFFAAGARLIDTSPMYSTAETVLGDLLTPSMHEHVFLATKVWTRGEAEGIEQMKHSAQVLKHPKLDLIQVHNLLDLDTHLKTLRAWKDEGRVRYIGVTHFTVSAHSDLEKVIEREKLDFVQLNYSATTRDAEQRLLPLAADRGVAVLVNRPFEDGRLFQLVEGRPLPPWAADIECTSWGQIFLKFVLSHPAVTCAIPATSKVKHLQDNLAGARGRMPDAKQRDLIAQELEGT